MNNTRYLTLTGMILAAAGARLLPHPWNFTPIGAIALFAGGHFPRKWEAFLVPLTPLFLTDLLTGLHPLIPWIYACFAVTVCLGIWVGPRPAWWRVALAAGVSSTIFLLVTNFGVWVCLETYPRTVGGLAMCYLAGVPLFRNGLLGDLVYSGLLFGGLRFAEQRFRAVRLSRLVPAAAYAK